MAYCIMRTEKIKTAGSFTNKMHHNFRIGNVPNADTSRTALNRTLIPMKDETYLDAYKRILKENNHQPRANAVLGIEVMMTYNANKVDGDFDIDAWSEANVKWLKEQFGEENVISAVLHRDEGPLPENTANGAESGHIHAIVIPMVDGKLNAKHFLGGRGSLIQMQTNYAQAMEPFGLERGIRGSKAEHEKIQKFYSSVNKIFDEHLPSPLPNETKEEYAKRVDDIFLENNLKHLQELKNKDREIVEAKSKKEQLGVNETISLQSALAFLEREKRKIEEEKEKLEKDKERFEKMIANDKDTLAKIYNMDLLTEGLKTYPDRDLVKEVGKGMNKLTNFAKTGEYTEDKDKPDETI